MKRSARKFRYRYVFCTALFLAATALAAVACSLFVEASPKPKQFPENNSTTQKMKAAPVAPNFELAARFVPSAVSRFVFDMRVTPHWFELSDKFWYSYETPAGTRYWIVDPVRRAKSPLFDNAKLAEQLSVLTGFAYDAQHLPIKNLKLVKKDAALQFDIEVANNAVIPNEPKKQEDKEETIQEGENQKRQQQNQQIQSQEQKEKKPQTRKIYFEYDLATAKVTRLDGFEAPPERPIWASFSPDEKTIVFARGDNLYMMDAANYVKAAKNTGDKSIVETQLTTDGVEKYSYARHLVPEEIDALKKYQKGDTNKPGPRVPAVPLYWSKDSTKFSLIRSDDRKVADLWVIHTLGNPRPVLETYSYAMAGDANAPQEEMMVLDVASKQ